MWRSRKNPVSPVIVSSGSWHLVFIKHLVGERLSFTDLHRPVTQRGQTHFTIIQGTMLN